MIRLPLATALPILACVLTLAAGCRSTGEIDATGGITAVRTACPRVAIPAGTGDVTLFDPAGARTAEAIDVSATMTDLTSTCNDQSGDNVVTTVSFKVQARRRDTAAARDVVLPYFVTVVRGGTAVTAKRVGRVGLHFDAGQARAETSAQGTTTVSRAAATLPDEVRKKLTEKRKAGSEDAATDPLSRPDVRQAVLSATFEALVGFQLTDEQLRYNATR